jgi:hypothetical protein
MKELLERGQKVNLGYIYIYRVNFKFFVRAEVFLPLNGDTVAKPSFTPLRGGLLYIES